MMDNCKQILREAILANKEQKRDIFTEEKVTPLSLIKNKYLYQCEFKDSNHGVGFKMRLQASLEPLTYPPSTFFKQKTEDVEHVKN
jgi:hypothetical protein